MAKSSSLLAVDTTKSFEEENSFGDDEAISFTERLSSIPMYAMTISQLQSAYDGLKEKNDFLKKTLDTSEQCVQTLRDVASPVVWAATNTALKVAKPVVGDDPMGRMDSAASEVLAKVQEVFPIVNQTPSQIATSTKTSIQEKTNQYVEKVKESRVADALTKQADTAVSFSELMVEICLPTQGSDPEDVMELEKAEEDEDKGIIVRATNLKNRAKRRGRRQLLTYRPVQATVDVVQYTQVKIAEMNEKLWQGTNYVSSKANEVKDAVSSKASEVKENVISKVPIVNSIQARQPALANGQEEQVISNADAPEECQITDQCQNTYTTNMYIPKKALQATGKVIVSAKEIVFSYTKAESVRDMPRSVMQIADDYYSNLRQEVPIVDSIHDKAVAFVSVPAQVVSKYIHGSRSVQWILPKSIGTNQIQVFQEADDQSSCSRSSKQQ